MKVIVKKGVLESIVSYTNPYLEKKDLSSITSHILISAMDGVLSIKATDHEIGLSYKNRNVTVIDEGYATANGSKLMNAIKGLEDDEITLETAGNSLFVKQKRSKYKLPMYNYTDFPEFPTIENKNRFEINSIILGRSLKKIFPSIDTNNPKYELNGALIDIKEKQINLVSTDTKRLSLYTIPNQTSTANEKIIIPKKAINEIQKLFSDKVEIFYDANVFLAVSESFEFFSKLINGKFPMYDKLVDTVYSQSVMLPRDKMVEGIKAINSMCDSMKITIKNNSILFESISEDNSEAKTEIKTSIQIENQIEFSIRNKFLMDFLSNIEENSFKFDFNNEKTAFCVSSGDLKTIIMPIIA